MCVSGISVARANKKKGEKKSVKVKSEAPFIIELNVDVINGNLDEKRRIDEENVWTGLDTAQWYIIHRGKERISLYLDLKISNSALL